MLQRLLICRSTESHIISIRKSVPSSIEKLMDEMYVFFLGKIQCSLLNVTISDTAVIASYDCHGTGDTAASGPQNSGK